MKKLLAFFTALALIFCLAAPAFAADVPADAQTVTAEYPLIIVRGMQFKSQYLDVGTENERYYLNLDFKGIASAVMKALGGAIGETTFAESLAAAAYDFFDHVSFNPDGTSKYNVGVWEFPGSYDNYYGNDGLTRFHEVELLYAACNRYGAENVYYFTYDWRNDPYDIAEDLSVTVDRALADHGADKVNIICGSFGGMVTSTYMARYGYGKLNSVMFNSGTQCGTIVATELFQGKAIANEKALCYLLENLSDNFFVKGFMNFLVKTGVVSAAVKALNRFIEKNKDLIYARTLKPTFGTVPGLWALVLPDETESCIEYMFPTDELKEEYSEIIARARRMAELNTQCDARILQAVEDGVKITFTAGYNRACVPFYESAATQSDGALESSLMLGRATVSDVGETLGDDYVPADPNKLSPDRTIDLSGALLPESTWAFRNAEHVAMREGSDLTNFYFALIESEVQPTAENTGVANFQNLDKHWDFIPFD
ncbi:MAG: hypothetical protein IJK23_04215 [Clostridia bacterium]|nr:hypothetical protein [Clostridia bacterium]